jgi:hypothetical protein
VTGGEYREDDPHGIPGALRGNPLFAIEAVIAWKKEGMTMERPIDLKKMLGPRSKQSDHEKALAWLNSSDPAHTYVPGTAMRWLGEMSEEDREEFGFLWQEMINSLSGEG